MDVSKEIPVWVSFDENKKMDILHQLNFFDVNERDVLFAIIDYAQIKNTNYIPLPNIYYYIQEYGLRIHNVSLRNDKTISAIFKKLYQALYQYRYCKVDSKDNRIVGLMLIDPNKIDEAELLELVGKFDREYNEMDIEEGKPFPSGEGVSINSFPENVLIQVNVKELTPQKIHEISTQGFSLVKILLPGSGTIIVPADKITGLYEKAFAKMRQFFAVSKDFADQIMMKMKQQYPIVKHFNSPDELFRLSDKPTQFYTALGNEILMNLNPEGKNKVMAQATEIFKNLTIIHSELEQRKVLVEKMMEILLKTMEEHSVFFGRKNLLTVREKNQLLKACPEADYLEMVEKFLASYSQPQADGSRIIVPVKIHDETYYIHHRHFFNIFLTKIDAIAYEMKQNIIKRIDLDPLKFMKEPFMKSKEAFDNFITATSNIRDEFVVVVLKNPLVLYTQLLFLASQDIQAAQHIRRFFATEDIKSSTVPPLRPLSELLKLDYLIFQEDARSKVPFQLNTSFIRTLIGYLVKFFKNLKKSKEEAEENIEKKRKNSKNVKELGLEDGLTPIRKEELGPIIRGLKDFKKTLIEDRDIYETMNLYESRWNLALSKDDRQRNLDLVREKISRRLKYIRFPSGESIQKEAADMVVTDDILKIVRDQDSLIKYIVLYMTAYFINLESI